MAAATAAATAQQQMQTLDPALTMADTQALLGTDFPAMRDFAHVVGSTDPLPSYGGHQQQGHQQQHVSAMQNDPYCGDSTQHRLPMPSLQPDAPPLAVPQMRAACKAEPTSPAGGGGGWVPVSGWGSDGGGAYNSFMGASPFGDCSGEYADMAAHFGMDAGSWNSADEVCFPPWHHLTGTSDFLEHGLQCCFLRSHQLWSQARFDDSCQQ